MLDQELSDVAQGELERSITKDARKQVREGFLEGPIKETSCREAGTGSGPATEYTCLAINKESGETSEGYEYQATADTESGELTWELGD